MLSESKITMFDIKLQVNYNYDSNSFDISVIPTRFAIPKTICIIRNSSVQTSWADARNYLLARAGTA